MLAYGPHADIVNVMGAANGTLLPSGTYVMPCSQIQTLNLTFNFANGNQSFSLPFTYIFGEGLCDRKA